MTRHLIPILALAALVAPYAALGDTLYLKSGVRIDGKVAKQQDDKIVLDVGGRRTVYRASEVLRVEENDKTGGFDKEKLKAQALQRAQELYQKTGLTAEQRSKVRALMAYLQSPDPAVATEARNKLVAMGKQVDLIKYFEYHVPSLSPRFMAGVLEVVFALDKKRAMGMLKEQVENPDAATRAKALELMGQAKKLADPALIARGLVDYAYEPRQAAALALGLLEEKRATPALIANLSAPDARVQNACRRALQRIWSTPENVVNFGTAEEWGQFWQQHSAEVSPPFTVSSLKPLVKQGVLFVDE